jgi:uncharacterized protein YdaU (DUF1376 family)
MHYYPHHIGDYSLATLHLEPLEDLAYRRLLDHYYSTEAPIPLETQRVASRLRLGCEVVEKVLSEFFTREQNGWHQKRCDAEIAEYAAMAERNKRNGKQGGRPKKTQRVATGNPLETQRQPTGKPTRTKNQNQNQEGESASLSLEDEVVKEWNNFEALPKCLVLNAARRAILTARLKEDFFANNAAEGMEKIAASDFCQGKNDRGWKAGFDWFIAPKTLPKVMEGQYDNKTGANGRRVEKSQWPINLG